MYKRLLPNSDLVDEMLRRMGLRDISDLFSDVPKEIMLEKPPDIGRSLSEVEIEREFDGIALKNIIGLCFMGGGCWFHYVPAVVDEIAGKQEFYTSYTPYQAEVSQGALQAIFEYQSLMAELLNVDVVTASHYDWSTALAEAAFMSARVTHRRKIMVPGNMHPEREEVLKTYARGPNLKIERYEFDRETGEVDLSSLKPDDDTAMVYFESPNFFGIVERGAEEIAEIAHEKGALLTAGVDPLSLGIFKPPEADIVVGEGQHLGSYPSFGGPSLGIIGVRMDARLIRQLPGRLIGMTESFDGKRGYCMALQTREQHIRHEAATSNITTNESLMAIRAAVYLSLLGRSGIRSLCEKIIANTNYMAERMEKIGLKPVFKGVRFREVAVNGEKDWVYVNKELLKRGIIGGAPLRKLFPGRFDEIGNIALFSTTELHRREDIDLLINSLREVI
ncbi:MAG: aminomethyl-transferring glycine dehydrogenase subunit GcvPA [Candidatus Methanodesulfokora sp.]